MSWFFYAFLVPVLWAFNVVIDEYILRKKLKDPYSYDIWTSITDIFPIFFILFLFNPTFIYPFSVFSIAVGFLIVVGIYYYNKALMKEEASRVVSLGYSSPIFVALLAFFFLNQVLEIQNYVGIFLIVFGAIIVSERAGRKGKIKISPVLGIVLFYAILFSIADVVTDYSVDNTNFISFFYWSNIGSLVGGMMMLLSKRLRSNFASEFKKLDQNFFILLAITVLIFYTAELSLYKAFELGLVSLVSTVIAIEPMFVFIYVTELGYVMPNIFKEEFNRRVVAKKITAILLILLGTYLVGFL